MDLMDGLTGSMGGRGREPRARYGVRGPESSFLVGASLWWQALGDRSGYAHFPAGAPNAGPPLWLRRGREGGLMVWLPVVSHTPVKEN